MSNKGALALLADYEGNSSDEEAPSRCFSTKRLHRDEENEDIRIKRVTKFVNKVQVFKSFESNFVDYRPRIS